MKAKIIKRLIVGQIGITDRTFTATTASYVIYECTEDACPYYQGDFCSHRILQEGKYYCISRHLQNVPNKPEIIEGTERIKTKKIPNKSN